MSRSNTVAVLACALAVAACHPRSALVGADSNAQAGNSVGPLAANAGEDALCRAIGNESKVGVESMEVALGEELAGQQTPTRIQFLTKTGDYHHVGSEMLAGHCWTYGQLVNDPHDPIAFNTAWRCPVRIVSDDAQQPGATLVEAVDDGSCEFNKEMGVPTSKTVQARVMHLPAS